MIIYGTRGKEIVEGYGSFTCPVCRMTTACTNKSIKRYFTLYFIPLFPINTVATWVECGQCGGQFKPEAVALQGGADAGLGGTPLPGSTGLPGAAAVATTDSNATAALAMGIAALVLVPCCSLFSIPLGFGAMGMGAWSLKRQGENPQLLGRGQAIAGIALGAAGGLGAVLMLALGLVGQLSK